MSAAQEHLLATLPVQTPAHLFAEIAAETFGGACILGLMGVLVAIGGGAWWSFALGMGAGALCGGGIGSLIAVHTRQEERRQVLRLQEKQLYIQELALQVIGKPVEDQREQGLNYADFEYFLRGVWGEIGPTFRGWTGKVFPSGRQMTQVLWEDSCRRIIQWMKVAHRTGEHQPLTLDVDLATALKRAGYAPVVSST